MKVELTEENWKFADEIMEIVCERLEEMADKFIEIFDIKLEHYMYYKMDRVRLRITFWESGCMGDPTEKITVYRDENNCRCNDINLTKNDILNPEQWYTKMRKLKAEQDRVRDIRNEESRLYNEELRREQYEKLREEFEEVKE